LALQDNRRDRALLRIETLRKKIVELGYDAYLAADEMDVRYLTGIPVPQSQLLLVKPDGNHIIYVLSDGLRTAESKVTSFCEIKAADVGQDSLEVLLADLPSSKIRVLGFDSLSAGSYLKLSERFRDVRFVSDAATMWGMRMIKSNDEIANVRKAAMIADRGQKTASEVIRSGMREYEVAAEVEHTMRVLGSEDEGHRTVVSSGLRTVFGVVSGFSTNRTIGEGEFVIVDTGATIDGYRTDLGRTYVAGKPTPKQQEIYKLVQNAWQAAFSIVRPGAECGDVDAAARKAFGSYEKFFDHEVGHGLGLSFEPPPLGKNSKEVLKENMVVTVEPGLYIDGFGAVLLEDTTLVSKNGAERLTAPPLSWND
jgi:Xaa-Pro aminopeptidase